MQAEEWLVDRVVLPHCVLAGARVAASNQQVVAIDQQPAAANAVRLHGTLLPGLIDLQVNGAGGHDVMTAEPSGLDAIAAAVWRGGATAFLPTLITAPWDLLLARVAAVANWLRDYRGPHATPLGLHVEGPFLTAAGAHDASCLLPPTAERLAALYAAAAGSLRLLTLSPGIPGAAAATEWLTARGVVVALGHCADATGFADCKAAGARAVTHLFNAMGSLHHREPGLAGLAMDDASWFCPVIADGVHVHPVMLRHAFRILGPDRLLLVTDAMAAAGMPDGRYELGGMAVQVRAGVVRDAAGRLAGSALTMAQALQNFRHHVPEAGEWTLARLASTNPARLLGLTELGSIAIGQRARFSLLAADGSLQALC